MLRVHRGGDDPPPPVARRLRRRSATVAATHPADAPLHTAFVVATAAVAAARGRIGDHALYDVRRLRQRPWRYLVRRFDALIDAGAPREVVRAVAEELLRYVDDRCAKRGRVVGAIRPADAEVARRVEAA